MKRKHVTVLSFSPIHRDARVLRHVRGLSQHYDVSVVGYGEMNLDVPGSVTARPIAYPPGFLRRNVRAVPNLVLGRVLPTRGYDRWYWQRQDHRDARKALDATPTDLILANDWDTLPVAVAAADKWGAQIVLDLHEYSPAQWDNRRVWMFLIAPMIDHFLRRYSGRVAGFVTVGQEIANRYANEYGFRATVVRNVPELTCDRDFRSTDPQAIRLIHHGAPIPERRLDNMIRAVALAGSRYSLDFMLVDTNRRHAAHLQSLANQIAPGRVTFQRPVAPDRILDTISAYDMGLYVLPPTSYNCHVALPNKFFDFLAAGLAVCIGPSPEMARLTRELDLGVVAEDFEPSTIARCLDSLSADDIDTWKRNSLAARSCLSSETESSKLIALVSAALGETTV